MKISGRRWRFISVFIILFSLISLCSCSDHQKIPDPSEYYLFEDSTTSMSAFEAWGFYSEGRFEKQNSSSFNPGFTSSEFWLVVETTQFQQNLKLEIGTAQINVIEFYKIVNNKPVLVNKTGDRYRFEDRPESALNFRFTLDDNVRHYLLKIDKKNESLQLTFVTKPANVFSQQSLEANLIIGLFSGGIVVMLIFGVFLAIITRESLYLFYILYISFGWLYVLANLGYGYQYLWPENPWFTERARPVFAFLTISFAIYFLEAYTGKSAYKWLHYLLKSLAIIGILLTLLALAGLNVKSTSTIGYYFQVILPIIALIYLVGIFTSLIQKIVSGNKMAIFYLCSLLPIVVFTSIQLFYYSGGIDVSGSYLQTYGQPTGYVLESIVLTFGLVYRFNNYRLDREKLLIDITQQQAKYTKSLITTQENERRQLADQLHDVAGSLLSAAKLNLSSVRENNWITQPDVVSKITHAEEAVTHISEMLRSLSHAISPVMLDKVGFKQSIEKIVSIFNSSGKIKVTLEIIGFEKEQPLHHEKYSVLYGILYELMNNIVKHAKAKDALVQVIEHDDSIVMMVEDNGIGFDEVHAESKASHGLSAIRSKIHYLNGTIAFDKALPNGLIVTIEIPKEHEESNRIS